MGWFKDKALKGSLNQIHSGREDGFDSLENALQMGANPNAHVQKNLTPLMLAAALGDDGIPAAMVLIQYGANPLAMDKSGSFNAIEFAENHGFEGYADFLRNQSTSIEIKKKFLNG